MKNIIQQDIDAYKAVIFESPMPIALYVGRELRISLANKAVLRTWGKDSSVIGKTFEEALPEMKGQPFIKILLHAFDTGEAYQGIEELVLLEIDGALREFYFNFDYKPLKNEGGEVWGILNTATDVTELVMARKRADEAEKNLQFALEAAEIGTWDFDMALQLIRWDERCRRFYGFTHGVVSCDEIMKHIHKDDGERVKEAVADALNARLRTNFDSRFRVADPETGDIRWLHCIGKAHFNAENEVVRFSGTAQDITEQKNAEYKIRSAEQMAHLAVEGAGAGTFFIDLITRHLTYSASLSKIVTGKTVKGLKWDDFIARIHKNDQVVREQAYKKALQTGSLNYEARFLWDDGSVRWLRILGAFSFDKYGEPVRLMGICQDITIEVEAKEEQQKLLSLIENSSEYMAVVDSSGKIIYINNAARDMTWLDTGASMLGRQAKDIFGPEISALMLKEILSHLKQQGRWKGFVSFKARSGEVIPCHAELVDIRDRITGKLVAVGATLRDLRSEILSRKELAESEGRFRNMIEQAPVAMAVYKGEALVPETVNERMLQLLDKSGDIMGKPFVEALPELSGQPIAEALVRVYHSAEAVYGNDIRVVLTRRGKTEERYFDFSCTPLMEKGAVAGVLQVAADVTGRMHAKKALAESEALFRSITTASPAALWMSGEDAGMTYFNQAWLDWTGYEPDALMGTGWLNCIYEEDVAGFYKKYKEDFQSRTFHEYQFRIKHKDGTLHWLTCTGTPYFGPGGNFLGYMGACVDITELKQLQQQKDDFLGIASHELKTPVTSIKSYIQSLEILLRKDGDTVKADMIKKADKQVDRLTNLIGDLLDVTKINAGKLQFNDSLFHFNEAVAEVIEEMQRTVEHHRIEHHLDEQTGLVFGDRERISQVIVNLLSNAVKYSPDADRVLVFSRRAGDRVILSVQDFGIGIEPDKAERIFEQFYRIGGDRRHTFPGLGLGLYISSEIIKREGGRIWVDSTEGKGSVFSFSIPVDHRAGRHDG